MNNQQRIGIIGAMDSEVQTLIEHLTRGSITQKCGMLFCTGSLGKRDVVVVKGGVGKVNAAICTQVLIDEFQVESVINTGAAGGLDPRINVGDVVIATDAVYHDLDAVAMGYPYGQIPRADTFAFPIDESMANAVREAAEAEGLAVWRGRIASGDQFVYEQERKAWIAKTFGALCCEMEAAAIAQVCYTNQIPCVIVRAISDKADEAITASYDEFEISASKVSANIVEHMVERFDRSMSLNERGFATSD